MSVNYVHEPLFEDELKACEYKCFFCYEDLQLPIVHWMGSSAHIFLHPRCVIEMTIRMLRDVHEIECKSNQYVTMVGGERPKSP